MSAAIRQALASDVDGLVALEHAVFAADQLSRRSYRRLVASPSARVLVAGDRDRIAGCAIVLFRAGSRSARLYSIAVAPGEAGAGTGRALLSSAVAAAAERDCTELRLEVREDNPRAIALYERNGFVEFGRRPGYYADGATAIRYALPIAGTDPGTRPEARDPRTGKRTPS
jgi:ribosomal protein S18 acetylase RimI-like enzyme